MSGNVVSWYEGLDPATRSIKRVFSMGSEVIQAFWCTFYEPGCVEGGGGRVKGREGSSSSHSSAAAAVKCMCVHESKCLTLFMESGATHYVPFPFLVGPHSIHTSHITDTTNCIHIDRGCVAH